MVRLIINADDFGLTEGVNRGVIRAHREGVLTSATLMAGGLAWREAVALAAAQPSLGVGVHLTLTALQPVLPPEQVPSLVDRSGRFRRQFWRAPLLPPGQVEAEWRAQILRLLEAGLKPTHLDSHHHIHLWPPFTAIICRLARELGIPGVRMISPESFRAMTAPRYQRALAARAWHRARKFALARPATVAPLEMVGRSREDFAAYLAGLCPGVHELYCHPGSPGDSSLASLSSLTEKRAREGELLLAPWLANSLTLAGVVPASYKIFAEERV